MYEKILVPIEFSHEHSGINAIKIAKKLLNDGGEIILVNVVADIPSYVEVELPRDLVKDSKTKAAAKLAKIAEEEGLIAPAEVMTGQPATVILAIAEKHDVNLIIVASHRPGLSDYFLGSTAARIVRHAQCAVLVDR